MVELLQDDYEAGTREMTIKMGKWVFAKPAAMSGSLIDKQEKVPRGAAHAVKPASGLLRCPTP